MSFRSPISILNRDSLLGIQRIKENLAMLQEQLSTGKRLVRLSTDPAGSALVVDMQASLGANNQYLKQITDALGFQQASETVATSLDDGLARLLELGQQALNGTNGPSSRLAISHEVDGMRDTFINYGNTQMEGKYIFAGAQTQTKPFNGPATGPITYSGDGRIMRVDVGSSATTPLNIPGDTLFFGTGGQGSATDVIQQTTNLRDALAANNVPGIQAAYDNLRTIKNNLMAVVTDLGGHQATLQQMKSDLEGFNLTLQSIQNSVQDVDYPKTITDFTSTTNAQQAALSTLSKTNRQNLFDFLG